MGAGLPTAQSLIFRKENCGDGTDGGVERQTGFRRWITHLQNITSPIKKAVASFFGFHFVQISETRLRKNSEKKNNPKTNTGLTQKVLETWR